MQDSGGLTVATAGMWASIMMMEESVCGLAGQASGSVCPGFFFFFFFFFALHRVAADQAEALRVWSAVGVFGGAGHSGAVGGLEVSVSCSSREYTGL